MVGIIVGSGIFRTPTSIAAELENPILILLLWAAGGVLALLGALTFAEMACMFPESGGVYVFIREGFGRATAFVFGWTYMLISKPAAAAGIAMIFGENLNALLGTQYPPAYLTCVVIVLLTGINAWGVRLGARVAIVLTTLKIGALLAIIALAALWAAKGGVALGDALAASRLPQPKPLHLALIPVLSAILWTYDGWSDVGAIAGEVKDPQRNLPRIYLTGTMVITVIYVLVNLAYFMVVPISEMRTLTTVAPTVAERLLSGSGVVVTGMIVISTLGSTHGSIMTGARVTFAQARDGLMFRFLGAVAPRRGTPAVALWVQCGLSCSAALWLREFGKLADSFTFTMWIFYGLAGIAIFVLRARLPDRERPYRCWGYPVVPIVFVLCAAGMTLWSIIGDPRATLPWLGVLAAGYPVYWVWGRFAGTTNKRHVDGAPVCPKCDYSLVGLRVSRCPECGADVADARAG